MLREMISPAFELSSGARQADCVEKIIKKVIAIEAGS